jgi:hypothetical protein
MVTRTTPLETGMHFDEREEGGYTGASAKPIGLLAGAITTGLV